MEVGVRRRRAGRWWSGCAPGDAMRDPLPYAAVRLCEWANDDVSCWIHLAS